ncbi:Tudor, plant [Spatholobus suberectus]|nr:Tudor, plant [Spatholobus suberectus]
MDYDDNDFQNQNLHLAGEGSAKFPPVLRPFALPKFDFDESLHANLRFDSLVETEVFLGIESNEDNQWIDAFSRGGSGIEFSSTAAESCPISRHGNVWSEATSSESVEMLLKSVGQEDYIPRQTVIQESDACDELACLAKPMDTNPKLDDKNESKDSVTDLCPPGGDTHASFSGLKEDVGMENSPDGVSQGHEVELSIDGSSSNPELSDICRNIDLPVSEGSLTLYADGKNNNTNQREVETVADDSHHGKTQDDSSAVQSNIAESSMQNLGDEKKGPLQAQTNNQDLESSMINKDAVVERQTLDGDAVGGDAHHLDKPRCSIPTEGTLESGGVVEGPETALSSLEGSSRMESVAVSDLQKAEKTSEDMCFSDLSRNSASEDVMLLKDVVMDDQSVPNTNELPKILIKDDSSSEGQVVEVSNSNCEICPNLQQNVDVMEKMTHCGSSGNKEDELLITGDHVDTMLLSSKSEASVFTAEENKISTISEGNNDNRVGGFSSSGVTAFSTKSSILGESTQICVNNEPDRQNDHEKCNKVVSVNDQDELLNTGDHVDPVILSSKSEASMFTVEENNISIISEANSDNRVGGFSSSSVMDFPTKSSILGESTQICVNNESDKQNDHEKCDQVVSVNDQESKRIPSDSSQMHCDVDQSHLVDKGVVSLSLSKGSMETELTTSTVSIHAIPVNNSVSQVVPENISLTSHEIIDIPPSSSKVVSTHEVTSHNDFQGMAPVGSSSAEEREESTVKEAEEAGRSTLVGSSEHETAPRPVTGTEKHHSSDTSRQLLCDSDHQHNVGTSGAVKIGEPQGTTNDKVIQECATSKKHSDGVRVLLIKDDKETVQENPDKSSSEKLGGIILGNQLSKFSASVPDSCIELPGTGGESFPAHSTCSPSSTFESPSQTEKDKNQLKGSANQNTQVSEFINGGAENTLSTAQDLKENNASKDERSSTPEVNSVIDLCKKDVADVNTEDGGKMQSIPVSKTPKTSLAMEGFPSTPGPGPSKTKTIGSISHGNPQLSDVGVAHSASKATPERKTRRASNKTAGKESSRRGSHAKDTTPGRQSNRGDKSAKVSLSPSPGFQMMQSNEVQQYGNIDSNSTKSFALINTPTSSLPDLNTSASPPVLFHQPFTDLQQVQLRAQIFVYGALIQGTVPDEAYMISAFGGSDGGRSIWENAWRACMERQHGQKSHPANPETPLQSRSVARTSDLPPKQSAVQGKGVSSPLGRTSSKTTPPIVNPLIPLSSPLWSLSTLGLGSDSLQSSALARGSVVDYPQAIPPLHPYQTTPVRNFLGHNTPWISQSPLRGPWIASPTPAPDNSAHISASPAPDTIKLGSIKGSLPPSSGIKNVTSGLPTSSAGLQSIFGGTASLLDASNVTVPPAQHSSDPKPKKRKKVVVSEDLGQRALQSLSPAVGSHTSTSVAVVAPVGTVPITPVEKSVVSVSPLADQSKNDRNVEKRIMSDESLMKVKEARVHAEEASALSAAAVNHSLELWNQLDKHKNSGLMPDSEAKLASAAVAAAAAAAIAKAAAAAANVASNAALQAKLMADEALLSSGYENSSQSNQVSLSEGTNNLGKATPASILKGANGTNNPGSIIVAAKEAVKRRVEAASAATKRAENMDAIVRAAELAAEAVSQAGKIVTMGDPLPLSHLVAAGPEGCLKATRESSQQVGLFKDITRDMANIDNVRDIPETSNTHNRDILSGGISASVKINEKNSRGPKGRKVSDLVKPVDVVPGTEPEIQAPPFTVSNGSESLEESNIKEGLLVEVFRDEEGFKAAWFTANILSLKDDKAYVCYTSLVAAEGAGPLKEWVSLECEGDKPPRIRTARPLTTLQYEGTRKRRRAAMGDYAWSVGDRVDAWLQESWREGVITEKNKKDETTFTVHFPASGETLVVRAWHLRPSLIWKDGKWIESSKVGANDSSTHEGDTPNEKRPKLGSHAVELKGKDKMSKGIDAVESAKPDEMKLLNLTENDKVFNIGKSSKNENKLDAQRMVRTGLQKEGSKVIFGVPKPGKKRKFMEVSKHYVAHESSKINDRNDSVKLANFLMPQSSGPRGWKNSSKNDAKEKHGADSKPKTSKSGKLECVLGRVIPPRDISVSNTFSLTNELTGHTERIKDSSNHFKNASQSESKVERATHSATDGATVPILFSSLATSVDAHPTKRASTSRASKGKLAPARDKLGKVETEKALNDNSTKSTSDVIEPRRSNRRIQPTSRLLEGLQSSLIISKIPSVSHNRNTKG